MSATHDRCWIVRINFSERCRVVGWNFAELTTTEEVPSDYRCAKLYTERNGVVKYLRKSLPDNWVSGEMRYAATVVVELYSNYDDIYGPFGPQCVLVSRVLSICWSLCAASEVRLLWRLLNLTVDIKMVRQLLQTTENAPHCSWTFCVFLFPT